MKQSKNNSKRHFLILLFIAFLVLSVTSTLFAAGDTINVPGDASSIQDGIDLANDGDTVLVSPGTYNENLTIAGKTIILASHFHTTGDESYIDSTIIDGKGGSNVFEIADTVGPDTTIVGFTIRNAEDGLLVYGDINLLHNHITDTTDGIDYEGAGGVNSHNLYDQNNDDGIDLDYTKSTLIEDNVIVDNHDDGIEIRLHDMTLTEQQNIIIRNNVIKNNGEDGIQFIDYYEDTNRVFTIERNIIANNAMAGIGLMGGANTRENYEGASITERIQLFNNTIIGHDHGLTGGDNLVAVNNIIANSRNIGVKNTDGSSMVAFTLFWNNGTDIENSNVDTASSVFGDPKLDPDFKLQFGAAAIDKGTPSFTFANQQVLEILPEEYNGANPDVGYDEFGTPTAIELVEVNGSSGGHSMILVGTLLFMAFVSLGILQRRQGGAGREL